MTKVFLNTLYVGTQNAVVRLDNDQVKVELEGEKLLQVPLHHLGSIVLFGLVHPTVPLMARCADDGRTLAFMTEWGRFRARVQGKTSGNVLLRKAQYDFHANNALSLEHGRKIVAGKLQSARLVLLRAAREAKPSLRDGFDAAVEVHESALSALPGCLTLDEVRGQEGMAAQEYFEVFDGMITAQRTDFRFDGRSRRPPRDSVNCLMSFLYSLWVNDTVSALEGVGLDPQFGILHVLRPGRPALALDLVEEFRSVVLDRLCLSLINRRQVSAGSFVVREGGSVMLTDEGRKEVLVAYQRRKQQEVKHPGFKEKVPIGLLPHVQARILARVFRGDLEHYHPYRPVG